MKYLITVLAVITATFALKTAASCPFVAPGNMPSVPDGASADAVRMQSAMTEVRTYVQASEEFLDCRGLTLSTSHYREVLNNATEAADTFNAQLARFRENNGALAKN
ncbi:Uncharacterised protein [Halioglobus japonicus]|nr:Uncharacterised protein [Halioglobus japonicus]